LGNDDGMTAVQGLHVHYSNCAGLMDY